MVQSQEWDQKMNAETQRRKGRCREVIILSLRVFFASLRLCVHFFPGLPVTRNLGHMPMGLWKASLLVATKGHARMGRRSSQWRTDSEEISVLKRWVAKERLVAMALWVGAS